MLGDKMGKKSVCVLDLCANDARNFFLVSQNYSNIDLPVYFDFTHLLGSLSEKMSGKTYSELNLGQPAEYENVNYKLLSNKDSKYSWRPFELINPVLYVSLVNVLTNENNWETIKKRFKHFHSESIIECKSIPVVSQTSQKDKAVQINSWWETVEQDSLSLALEYSFLAHTDITDFYPSIYTHSIPWSLHDKHIAKRKHFRIDPNPLGNQIDTHLRAMSFGQTNGIPQGSVLMDFISEMLLGCIDVELTKELKRIKITKVKILRYRDDYRIFTENQDDAHRILKVITELLSKYGLKLNSSKTFVTEDIIKDSVKPYKYFGLTRSKSSKSVQKRLLQIHNLADEFRGSGILFNELKTLFDRIDSKYLYGANLSVLISIIVDILIKNPRVIPLGVGVLSKFFNFLPTKDEKENHIKKIQKKFAKVPNTGLVEIWLQRLSLKIGHDIFFEEDLCGVVLGAEVEIWNSEWILNNKYKAFIKAQMILDKEKLEELQPVMEPKEIDLFGY